MTTQILALPPEGGTYGQDFDPLQPGPRYPVAHDTAACAASMLAELAGFYFPPLAGLGLDSAEPDDEADTAVYKLMMAAGQTLAEFGSLLQRGRHGPACIRAAEDAAADKINARGWIPVCATCSTEIHLFPGSSGWQHYFQADPGADAEITDPGHAADLTFRPPGYGFLAEPIRLQGDQGSTGA